MIRNLELFDYGLICGSTCLSVTAWKINKTYSNSSPIAECNYNTMMKCNMSVLMKKWWVLLGSSLY